MKKLTKEENQRLIEKLQENVYGGDFSKSWLRIEADDLVKDWDEAFAPNIEVLCLIGKSGIPDDMYYFCLGNFDADYYPREGEVHFGYTGDRMLRDGVTPLTSWFEDPVNPTEEEILMFELDTGDKYLHNFTNIKFTVI